MKTLDDKVNYILQKLDKHSDNVERRLGQIEVSLAENNVRTLAVEETVQDHTKKHADIAKHVSRVEGGFILLSSISLILGILVAARNFFL